MAMSVAAGNRIIAPEPKIRLQDDSDWTELTLARLIAMVRPIESLNLLEPKTAEAVRGAGIQCTKRSSRYRPGSLRDERF